MSIDMTSRYIVRPAPAIPPASTYYVFDTAGAVPVTVATCLRKTDAERVRTGLELVDALEQLEQANDPEEVAGAAV